MTIDSMVVVAVTCYSLGSTVHAGSCKPLRPFPLREFKFWFLYIILSACLKYERKGSTRFETTAYLFSHFPMIFSSVGESDRCPERGDLVETNGSIVNSFI